MVINASLNEGNSLTVSGVKAPGDLRPSALVEVHVPGKEGEEVMESANLPNKGPYFAAFPL